MGTRHKTNQPTFKAVLSFTSYDTYPHHYQTAGSLFFAENNFQFTHLNDIIKQQYFNWQVCVQVYIYTKKGHLSILNEWSHHMHLLWVGHPFVLTEAGVASCIESLRQQRRPCSCTWRARHRAKAPCPTQTQVGRASASSCGRCKSWRASCHRRSGGPGRERWSSSLPRSLLKVLSEVGHTCNDPMMGREGLRTICRAGLVLLSKQKSLNVSRIDSAIDHFNPNTIAMRTCTKPEDYSW